MSLTVQQIYDRARKLAGAAGSCDEADFMDRINNAGEMFLKRVDSDGMMFCWRLCTCGGCVVLPSSVHGVRQAWFDGDPVDIRSEWWNGRLTGGLSKDISTEIPWRNFVDTGRRIATQRGVDAQDGEVFEIRHFDPADTGKEFKIYYNGPFNVQTILKGKFKADIKPSFSKTGIGEVARFEKPRTAGNVELWAYHLETGHRRLLAVYGPREENPEYRVFTMSGLKNGALNIKGKRAWVPVRSMEDIIWFGDTESWGAALLGEAAWSDGNLVESEQHMQYAVGVAAMDLKSKKGNAQGQHVQFITPWSIKNNRGSWIGGVR